MMLFESSEASVELTLVYVKLTLMSEESVILLSVLLWQLMHELTLLCK